MITGAIKNKVDKIWTDIWAGGITNPLTVIEQLTYLMFIRSLDEKELETEEFENMSGEKMEKIFPQSPIGQSMRWSKFKNDDPRDIYDVISQRVFPAIKNMKHGHLPDFTEQGEMIEIMEGSENDTDKDTAFARYMSDAMFLIPTPQVLQKIITGFDTDRTMLRLSAMNLMLHSITYPEIDYQDSVSKQNQIRDKFTICLANPPFKGTIENF